MRFVVQPNLFDSAVCFLEARWFATLATPQRPGARGLTNEHLQAVRRIPGDVALCVEGEVAGQGIRET